METETGKFLAEKTMNIKYTGQGTGPSTGSSCFVHREWNDEESID